MTLAELMARYEERVRAASAIGSSAPLAKVYRDVIEDLSHVDGIETAGRWMTTAEAAGVFRVSAKTIRKWRAKGRFPGARKTSGDQGEWRIPAHEVYRDADGTNAKSTSIPKLWRPDE